MEKVHAFLLRCLQIISLLTVGLVFILNFLYTATVSSDAKEIVTIKAHTLKSVGFVLLIGIFLLALTFLKGFLEKIKEKHIFFALSIVYVVAGIYLIGNVDHILRADALFVSRAANNLLSGDSLAALQKGGYIYQYPHQVGLMLYDMILYVFCRYTAINFIANLGFVFGINYLIYKITDLLFENRLINNLSIILSFAFLPQFFFILFAYGNIPGLFFMVFAFYHTLRFCKNHSVLNLVLMALGACLAVTLRKNFLIGVVAIAIYLCLEMLKKFSAKRVIALVCVFIGLIVPLKILPQAFVKDASGMPSTLWIAMGTDIDNNKRGPGWYDESNNTIFMQSGYDSEIAHNMGVEKIKQNLEKIVNEPLKAGKFFVKKTVSQWCNPLYQSLWSGPLEESRQYTHTRLLKSLYTGGTAEKALSDMMKIYMLAFFGFALYFVIKYHKQYSGWELFFMVFIGGFIFHIIWEGKSQYVYPYFFSLMPFVAFSAANILIKCNALIKIKKAK